MYVCMHVYLGMYVCMYDYMYMYVCIMYVCVCKFVCIRIYVCMYLCMYVCMYVCMYECMYVCVHVCIRHLQTYFLICHCICDLNMFNTHVYTTYVLIHASMHIYVRTYI